MLMGPEGVNYYVVTCDEAKVSSNSCSFAFVRGFCTSMEFKVKVIAISFNRDKTRFIVMKVGINLKSILQSFNFDSITLKCFQ